jgi:hypothetical protein
MSRGALEAMLSVQGQQEFAAAMDMAMGKIKELAVTADTVSKNFATMGTKMDAAFSPTRTSGIRAMNSELSTTKGHLSQIVQMLGGGGLLTAFGVFEGVKNAAQVQTNQMQWVTEGGASQSMVPSLAKLAGSYGSQGLSNIDAGSIIRQVESAYNGKVSANDPRMTGIIKNAINLSAISGGAISVNDAAGMLIPALQVDPTLKNDPTKASQVLLAMIGSGNMQTQDAMSILQTQALGVSSGLGLSLADMAPFYAFGADTRSGQQAASFARTLSTSFLNLAKGGANAAGVTELGALLGTNGTKLGNVTDINKLFAQPGGAEKVFDLIGQQLSKLPGGITGGAAKLAIQNIYGGVRGGAGPLSIYSDPTLWSNKEADVQRRMDPMYYNQATGLALSNEQHKAAVVRAEFSNLLTNVGQAALPLLNKALPALTTMFRIMADPNIIKFAEVMLALRGASMLGGGLGSLAADGGITAATTRILSGANSKLNPFKSYAEAAAGEKAATAAAKKAAAIRKEGTLTKDGKKVLPWLMDNPLAILFGGAALEAWSGQNDPYSIPNADITAGVDPLKFAGIARLTPKGYDSAGNRLKAATGTTGSQALVDNLASTIASQIPFGNTVQVFPSAGMDETALAQKVAKELAKQGARK